MAITVISEADKVSFAQNKAIFKVQTDAYLESSGIPAVFVFQILDIPTNGDSFRIIWDNYAVDIIVEFVTYLESMSDSTGLKIRDDQTSLSNVATVIQMKLATNVLISEAYTVTKETIATSHYVKFTAKSVGLKYNLNTLITYSWAQWIATTLGENLTYDAEYYLITKIFYANDINADFQHLADISSKPLTDQSVQIDVSEILKSVVNGYHLPELNQTSEMLCESIHKAYKLVFIDKKPNAAGSYQPGPQVIDKVIVAGGLSKDHFADYPNPYTNWFADAKRFMTWFPNNRIVRQDQQHFISFLNYDESNDAGPGT